MLSYVSRYMHTYAQEKFVLLLLQEIIFPFVERIVKIN